MRFDVEPGTTKPRLAWPAAGVSFNVSHSSDQALFGIADASVNAIGVDIEEVRPDVDIDAVASRFFSAEGEANLSAIADQSKRREAYFACWTAKEAVVKGIGVGLDLPFNLFDVAVHSRQATAVTGRAKPWPGWRAGWCTTSTLGLVGPGRSAS